MKVSREGLLEGMMTGGGDIERDKKDNDGPDRHMGGNSGFSLN